MSRPARAAGVLGSPTTPAAIAIARSARDRRGHAGSPPARASCCPCPTSTSSSPFRSRSQPSPSRTRPPSTPSCSLTMLAANPRRLGAEIGAIAVLHTWGQALTHHPHLHCVVPGGGIAPDGAGWVHGRANFFLAVKPLARLFRRLFLERLAAAFEHGELRFFGDLAALADQD